MINNQQNGKPDKYGIKRMGNNIEIYKRMINNSVILQDNVTISFKNDSYYVLLTFFSWGVLPDSGHRLAQFIIGPIMFCIIIT